MDPNLIGVLAVTSTLGVGLIAAVFTAIHRITKVLGERIDDLREEYRHGVDDLREESRHGIDDLRSELRHGFDDLRSELRLGFDDLAQRIDALSSKLDDHVARSH